MNKVFSWVLSGLALLFFVPSFLIMISWNAIPGAAMYGLKTELEDGVLALFRGTSLESEFSVQFTGRRFAEAAILLDKKGSTTGYDLLVLEAKQTQEVLIKQQDSKRASELIAQINNYQTQIEQKQTSIQTGTGTVITKQSATYVPPTTTQTIIIKDIHIQSEYPAPIGVPNEVVIDAAESEKEVVDDLEETKEELEDIKRDLEKNLPPNASERAVEVHKNKEDNKKD